MGGAKLSTLDTVYDKYIADEKLKMGTKYERLAAVVFKILGESDLVIHDLRLRGAGKGAQHQIDVTIEKAGTSKRVLLECKDYDAVVGIGVVRDFYGAVHQIKPDEAFVVTTVGFTSGAVAFAQDEGIRLAILRQAEEADTRDRIMKIHMKIALLCMDTPRITWLLADEGDVEKARVLVREHEGKLEHVDARRSHFLNADGAQVATYQEVLKPILNSFERRPGETTRGEYTFDHARYIEVRGQPLRIRGFRYEFESYEMISESMVDTGGSVAVLLFRTMDGLTDTLLFDDDLSRWTFDDQGEVVEKED